MPRGAPEDQAPKQVPLDILKVGLHVPLVAGLAADDRSPGLPLTAGLHQIERLGGRAEPFVTDGDHVEVKRRAILDGGPGIAGRVVAQRMPVWVDSLHRVCEFGPRAERIFRLAADDPDHRQRGIPGDKVPPVPLESLEPDLFERAPTARLRPAPTAGTVQACVPLVKMTSTSTSVNALAWLLADANDVSKMLPKVASPATSATALLAITTTASAAPIPRINHTRSGDTPARCTRTRPQ